MARKRAFEVTVVTVGVISTALAVWAVFSI